MKTLFVSLLFLSAIFLSSAALGADRLAMVSNGRSEYEIVVAKDAFPITVRAVQDLQEYIAKATGARLPIRRGDAVGDRPAIVAGDGPVARAAGIRADQLPPEGFRIKTVGRNLYIVGRDTKGSADSVHWRSAPQSGTWYGVSEFLETQLGIRWFFPGELGDVVPKRKDLILSPMDVTDAPKMIYRSMGYVVNGNAPPRKRAEIVAWVRRNRMGWSIVWQASHSWIQWFKAETYFKKHPKWFALVNGRRLGYSTHGPQMCTTNPGALDEFARVIIEYGKKNPGVMFSLSPNDGGGHCECARCRALDVEHYPDGRPVLTDRYVTYCNEIARRVHKVLPKQTFGFYAYSYYALPPLRTQLDPSVYVMEVLNETGMLYYSPRVRKHHLEDRLLPWKKKVGRLFFYTHPEGNGSLGLPAYSPHAMIALFRDLHTAGVTGISMNNSSSFVSTGLNNWLDLRLAWDPSRDGEAMYREGLQLCYGPAAPIVRAYFDMVEDRYQRMVNAHIREYGRYGDDGLRRFPAVFEEVYPGLYEAGMPLLRKALAATRDPGERWRVQLLVDDLDVTRVTTELYSLGRKVTTSRAPRLRDIARCAALAKQRREWLARRDHGMYGESSRWRNVERIYNLPFDPNVYEFMLASAKGAKKKAIVSRVKRAPRIDGDLNDPAWRDLPVLNVNLHKDDATPSAIATRARICHDGEALYIAVACDEPLMSKVHDTITQHDGNVWSENELEFFFDTEDAARADGQICVNTLGAVFDKKQENGKTVEWDARVEVAVERGKDFWHVEMRIPFAAFGLKSVLPGDVWAFNLCRVRTVVRPAEYTCWSPTFGGFHQPLRFGKLIFH